MAAEAEQSTDAGERQLLHVLGLAPGVRGLRLLICSKLDHDWSRFRCPTLGRPVLETVATLLGGESVSGNATTKELERSPACRHPPAVWH